MINSNIKTSALSQAQSSSTIQNKNIAESSANLFKRLSKLQTSDPNLFDLLTSTVANASNGSSNIRSSTKEVPTTTSNSNAPTGPYGRPERIRTSTNTNSQILRNDPLEGGKQVDPPKLPVTSTLETHTSRDNRSIKPTNVEIKESAHPTNTHVERPDIRTSTLSDNSNSANPGIKTSTVGNNSESSNPGIKTTAFPTLGRPKPVFSTSTHNGVLPSDSISAAGGPVVSTNQISAPSLTSQQARRLNNLLGGTFFNANGTLSAENASYLAKLLSALPTTTNSGQSAPVTNARGVNLSA